MKEIRAGEAFQIVLSQRFAMPCVADALDVYRMLRLNNPSPYMYLFRFEDGIEVVVKVFVAYSALYFVAGYIVACCHDYLI